MVIDKEVINDLKKQVREEIIQEIQNSYKIKVLGREELQVIFNCGNTKMNEIMHSENRPPVVFVGRDYYTTERLMNAYFQEKDGTIDEELKFGRTWVDNKLNILYKKDLMGMFKMGRTKFKKFIEHEKSPISDKGRIIGDEHYITSDNLERWFYLNRGRTIELNDAKSVGENEVEMKSKNKSSRTRKINVK